MTFDIATKIVALVADLITATLGASAIWALIFHRKKITAFVRILAHTLINERVKRIKGSLGALDALDFDVKEHRKAILATLGELSGMLKIFSNKHPAFTECYAELIRLTELKEPLSEARKRRISEEIHSLLDEHSLDAALTLMEEKNGPKNTSSN